MKTYQFNEARDESIKYFGGDDLAAEVFVTKYALRNSKNELVEKTPHDMHKRIASELHRIEKRYGGPGQLNYNEILSLLNSWTIVPQGSPMSGIGNPSQIQSLSNCFVVEPPTDSYGGILKTDSELAQIMKRRGGVGTDISHIRPKGTITANAARTTDGIAVFMERFSNTCREVAQGGRRGALMLTIDIEHPEIETFIKIKKDLTKVTGANISIKVSDQFMEAVRDDREFTLRWPTKSSPGEAKVTFNVNARELWGTIVDAAWESAEPGILFWDTYVRMTPADAYGDFGFRTVSTNPCGELGLPPNDSCRLMIINVLKFVENPFTPNAYFDFDAFEKVSSKLQRLMDDLIDLEIESVDRIIAKINSDPEPEEVKRAELELWGKIKQKAIQGRRTGSNITALGDALAALGIRYGSPKSVEVTGKIYRSLAIGCWKETLRLAEERGPFEIFDHSLEADHPFINRIMDEIPEYNLMWEKTGRRNIALTTSAPAGSVSIVTQTSSGLEPVFMTSYKRRRKINPGETAKVDYVDAMGDKWQEYVVYHHGLKTWAEITGADVNDFHKSPYHLATANEIDWVMKIDLQAAAQHWVCHSLSNTLNLPNDVSKEIVSQVYFRGWETGCKGITVYRDGSRSGVLVAVGDETSEPANSTELIETNAPKRPRDLQCDIHRVTVKGEQYIVLVGLLDGNPYEVFAGGSEFVEIPKKSKLGTLTKNGKKKNVATYNLSIPIGDDEIVFKDIVELFQNPTYGAFSRTISLALRHGVPVNYLVEQLRKDKHSDMTSFSNVIARVLSKSYIPDGTKVSSEKICPSCESTNIIYQDGCATCMDCGWSKCS